LKTSLPIDIDQKILVLIQKRDQEGIKLLFEHHGPLLFGLIVKMVKMEDVAENALQDTFLKVWQSIDSYQPHKGRFKAWLINIARHTAIDVLRSKAYKKNLYLQPVQEELLSDRRFSSEPAIEHIGLKEVVGKIDIKYRQLIELIYFGGYTHAEVAEELGLPLGTVKSRLRKAFSLMRRQLE